MKDGRERFLINDPRGKPSCYYGVIRSFMRTATVVPHDPEEKKSTHPLSLSFFWVPVTALRPFCNGQRLYGDTAGNVPKLNRKRMGPQISGEQRISIRMCYSPEDKCKWSATERILIRSLKNEYPQIRGVGRQVMVLNTRKFAG